MTLSTQSSIYRFEHRSRIAIFAAQILIIAGFLICMLNSTSLGPTLDDSYIHYQYVKNLAEYGEVSFNPGQWSTGTTSLFWNILLLPGVLAGIPIIPLSLFLGIALYLVIGQQVYSVFKTYWKSEINNLLSVAIVIMTGNLAWYALSGMETLLFISLGLWWIDSFRKQRWALAGLLAGALMLTRIEGMLFFLLGVFFTIKQFPQIKTAVKPLLLQLVCGLPVTLPSFILNKMVTGNFYPTTMAGKKWLYGISPGFISLSLPDLKRFILSWAATLYQTNWWPQIIGRPSSLILSIGKQFIPGLVNKENITYTVTPYPLWFQALIAILSLIMLLLLLRGLYRILRPVWQDFFHSRETNAYQLLFYWFLGQNLIYILLMPHRGHGGRYQAVNFLLFGLFLIAGTDICEKAKNWKKILFKYLLRPLTLLIYFFSIITWADIYTASVLQVNNVHKAAGLWLKENLPTNTVVAAFDVGAIKYFSQLPIVDIAGLTDRETLDAALKGDIVPIMKQHGAEYLAMIEELTPRKHPDPQAIVPFNSMFYKKLGLTQQIGKNLNLTPVKRFSVNYQQWTRPWVALRTHSPVIVIYKIDWF